MFRLSCSDDGERDGAVRQVTVGVDSDDPPNVTLEARPPQVAVNGSTTLAWSAQGAATCAARGGWDGAVETSGNFATGPLTRTTSFTVACRGGRGHSLASVTVEVLDKVLRWRAPTRNIDGSPLTDLAGYRIYWGRKSGSYGHPHTIRRASITRWVADIPAGTYYFALTAFDHDGIESGYSNEVIKTIP